MNTYTFMFMSEDGTELIEATAKASTFDAALKGVQLKYRYVKVEDVEWEVIEGGTE